MAVGRTILEIIYYRLKRGTSYIVLGADHVDRINRDQSIKSHVRRFRALGGQVTLHDERKGHVASTQPALS